MRIFGALLLLGVVVLAIKLAIIVLILVGLVTRTKETTCILLGCGCLTLFDRHPVPTLVGLGIFVLMGLTVGFAKSEA